MNNHSSLYALPTWALPASALEEPDLLDQLNQTDRADWLLLRLVACTTLATLVLAMAIGLAH